MNRQLLKDATWLKVAFTIAELGTCSRRQVGVVFIDRYGHVSATGYNGPSPASPHCIDIPCPGANCPSGTGLDLCEAIHAEQNALIQCRFPMEVETVYCTDSPCAHCVKMLMATSAKRIVFGREYPHSAAKQQWERSGRLWVPFAATSNPTPYQHPESPS